jgi:hypothetical protein
VDTTFAAVNIVSAYRLDGWGSIPVLRLRPDHLYRPLSLLSDGYRGSFLRG